VIASAHRCRPRNCKRLGSRPLTRNGRPTPVRISPWAPTAGRGALARRRGPAEVPRSFPGLAQLPPATWTKNRHSHTSPSVLHEGGPTYTRAMPAKLVQLQGNVETLFPRGWPPPKICTCTTRWRPALRHYHARMSALRKPPAINMPGTSPQPHPNRLCSAPVIIIPGAARRGSARARPAAAPASHRCRLTGSTPDLRLSGILTGPGFAGWPSRPSRCADTAMIRVGPADHPGPVTRQSLRVA